jgi:hypothetical protein
MAENWIIYFVYLYSPPCRIARIVFVACHRCCVKRNLFLSLLFSPDDFFLPLFVLPCYLGILYGSDYPQL